MSIANPPANSAALVQRFLKKETGRTARFRYLVLFAAILVLLVLGAIMVTLFVDSLPVLQKFGFGFLTSEAWDPVAGKYGALPAVYGTLVTSLIAMLIAVPISFFIAFFLTELCPSRLRSTINGVIELLAGIPSIIYGMCSRP